MKAIILLATLFCLSQLSEASETNDEQVVVVLGEKDSTVLDCLVETSEPPVVIKWTKDDKVIIQWIRGQDPQVFHGFQDTVDGTYSVSDSKDEFRALSLHNLTKEMSGTYRCLVHTMTTTQIKKTVLSIVDLRRHSLTFQKYQLSNSTSLECTASQVYPEPVVSILSTDDIDMPVTTVDIEKDEDGYFNVSTHLIIDDNDDDVNIDEYKCVLSFDDIPYNVTVTITSGSWKLQSSIFNFFLFFITVIGFNILYEHKM